MNYLDKPANNLFMHVFETFFWDVLMQGFLLDSSQQNDPSRNHLESK